MDILHRLDSFKDLLNLRLDWWEFVWLERPFFQLAVKIRKYVRACAWTGVVSTEFWNIVAVHGGINLFLIKAV